MLVSALRQHHEIPQNAFTHIDINALDSWFWGTDGSPLQVFGGANITRQKTVVAVEGNVSVSLGCSPAPNSVGGRMRREEEGDAQGKY